MKNNERGDIESGLYITGFVLFILLIIGSIFLTYHFAHNDQNVTVTVSDKQAVATGKDGTGHEYLIYTDQGTFKDTDSIWRGKYNSSDIYGSIKVGQKYTFDVVGYRNGFLSAYRNIISITEAK